MSKVNKVKTIADSLITTKIDFKNDPLFNKEFSSSQVNDVKLKQKEIGKSSVPRYEIVLANSWKINFTIKTLTEGNFRN